jgi:hypothetical protein
MLSDYIRNPKFGYLFSFIMGVGIIVILGGGGDCKGDECKRIKAPPVGEVKDAVYKIKDKCYKFQTATAECAGNIVEAFRGSAPTR